MMVAKAGLVSVGEGEEGVLSVGAMLGRGGADRERGVSG